MERLAGCPRYEREKQYKPVIMKKLGITDGISNAESMAGYAKQLISDVSSDPNTAREEAQVSSSLFTDDSETDAGSVEE